MFKSFSAGQLLHLLGVLPSSDHFACCCGASSSQQAKCVLPETYEFDRHPITQPDTFDVTFTPRSLKRCGFRDHRPQLTPRQRDFRDQVNLPSLSELPRPPNALVTDTDSVSEGKLLETYRDFVLDLYSGMYLKQLTSNTCYSDVHCQLGEGLDTLMLTMSCGTIVEFPLVSVSKVNRFVKHGDRWFDETAVVRSTSTEVEHVVIMEFQTRKLAFSFIDLQVAQRFLMCMDLITRSVLQKQEKFPIGRWTFSGSSDSSTDSPRSNGF